MRSEKERSGSLPSSISLVIGLTNFGFWGGRGRCCGFGRAWSFRLAIWPLVRTSVCDRQAACRQVCRERGRDASRRASAGFSLPGSIAVNETGAAVCRFRRPRRSGRRHLHDFMRIRATTGPPDADVDQSAVGQPDIHERPEVDVHSTPFRRASCPARDLPA